MEEQAVSLLGAKNLASMRGKGKLNMLDDPWQYNLYSDIRKHNSLHCLPCPTSTFSMSYFNECSQSQKVSKIVYLYVKPLFLYYFLLIATMNKTMFVNSQQILLIILFICEVITLHKINIWSFLFLFILSLLYFPQVHSMQSKPLTQNYSLLYTSQGLDYTEGA